ncbi:hypothetical protein [Pseudomonas luteola]|uniref:hypothetical protein n=1 Tax=Pseudomonas luteola TaxID=47886 RepID=UPI00123C4E7F|nr:MULTISPECIES: hypothetical protein [Pseudomonas]MBA1249853.1 hypothetical protein [Pseudomonas zeshuii]QEU28840.1 hypothetical protein FOB45_14040 [Pseudomonas luteola]
MAIPTNADIDVAIPPRGRPNRAMTNQLLKAFRDAISDAQITDEQIAVAVEAYVSTNPPAPGKDAPPVSVDQIRDQVFAYLQRNPPAAGKDGRDGVDGRDGLDAPPVTDEQLEAQIAAYLYSHPPAPGKDGLNGKDGAPGINNFGAPKAITVSLAKSYQASDPKKAAVIAITLQAQSSISLSGAANNEGAITIGATNAVATGAGTNIATYKNNLGGGLVVGLNLNSLQANTYTITLPAGWWFAVRQTSGSGLQVVSAFEQLI